MSAFVNRMLLCACMTFALSLTGCGPKPVEPYSKPAKSGNSTFSDPDSGIAADDGTVADTGTGTPGDYAALDNLPSSPGGMAADIQNSPNAAPAVEALNEGSGVSQKASGFTDNESADYKRKNGRSSPQMKSIYYDFDQSAVRNDQVAKMEANAKHLKKNAGSRVIVEGNCDERGTKEYNLALGERRAMAAKKYLINLGVEAGRVRTMSFGEERPLFPGTEESDYELNRRSDFVLE
ncbi:MAG: peptidoglycan-associated lipoprotein [Candidatus Electronema aureum]|uniref:Peptidoglycan-associated lipoprotein n=1 Tax=Candidatus Electronema aureum TaxID=2005002 RepID=A0A521G0Z8_9BACT|nr:MAG: peptidoglycan-associated lipoprotein [Candidatus Electronema aureum]